ncbi:MAG: CDP-glycerol glycerophosphotransferase family protein [Ruminobacter sp.]|uniref:CDP-glycerol glycerophosphotransferase family protein n=1 Tax=Ruminobacter sp. TaxID=2774296 RepID=UPI001B751BB1|nr:CDP-glycerol glycerophosphotransferase family protein [Ruminobacter sp.]MBP3749796.1 CDP-glycerol glycerophosphotransferase family protein [Ruminobacter sp.]
MTSFITLNYIIKDLDSIDAKLNKLIQSSFCKDIQLNIFDTVGINDETKITLIDSVLKRCHSSSTFNNSFIPANSSAENEQEDTDEEPHVNFASLYNHALKISSSDYVNFISTEVDMSERDLKIISRKIKLQNDKFNMFCYIPYIINRLGEEEDYFVSKNNIIKENNNLINLRLESYFWSQNILKRFSFDEHAPFEYEAEYIINQLSAEKKCARINHRVKHSFVYEFDFYNNPDQYYKEWYAETADGILYRILQNNKNSPYAKLAVLYLLELRFACNRNNRNKNVLEAQDITDFYRACSKCLKLIDNLTIIKYNVNGKKLLPKFMSLVLLKIKYNNQNLKLGIYFNKNELVAAYDDNILDRSINLNTEIKAINFDKKNIYIDIEISNSYIFDFSTISCFAKSGANKYRLVQDSVYSLDKYFGQTLKRGYTGQITIPIKDLKNGSTVGFYLKYKRCVIQMPVKFMKLASRLANNLDSYTLINDFFVKYDEEHMFLIFNKKSVKARLCNELKLYKSILKSAFCEHTEEKSFAFKVILYRLFYWLSLPLFRKKQIWITFDQLFKGGDNGEYFFRYMQDNHASEIDTYYIINKDSEYSKNLKKKYSHVLGYDTFWSRIVALNAKYIFATRVDVKQYCGFSNRLSLYFRDLLSFDVFCLQHGLSIQQIAEYQNRLFDNTRFYFCVSPYEIENLMHPVYGYTRDQLCLTGAPRYDGLHNRDKKFVLITPTWRRNVTAGTNQKGHMHSYSENFKHTEYFRIYNSLINDSELINCAKETGYKLIYLLHPILSPQIDDFTRNDYVEILAGAEASLNYETILSEASLMVTDYSGIQYDFSFMRKPIVYYHTDTLPPQYDAKTMDFEEMGVGPVCKNHEQCVKAICDYMRNGCKNSDFYESRVDSFFAFTDHKNCERVYEETKKYESRLIK